MSKSGYPIWWDTTITVYNKYVNPLTHVISWFKTVLTDCFWQLTGSEVSIGNTVLDSKATICRIPEHSKYLDKQDWIKLPDDKMGDYFTIAPGDIIVKGDCDFVINEYTSGTKSTDLLNKYNEYKACMLITEFSNDTGVGRNNKHYVARGK